MRHIDLFSGIGGFALACQWVGIETICFVEIDKFCQKVLKRHWPDVPIVEDVNNVEEIKRIVANAIGFDDERAGFCPSKRQQQDKTKIRGRGVCPIVANAQRIAIGSRLRQTRPAAERSGRPCDNDGLLLTAGFPCQPFSNAGRKRGSADDRYLWPQTLTVIEAVKPNWIILENVPGILNMVFPNSEVGVASQATLFGVENDEICDYNTISGRIESDLRQAGYETVWLVIPACGVGAPHRRDRVWIVANREGLRFRRGADKGCAEPEWALVQGESRGRTLGDQTQGCDSHATDTQRAGLERANTEGQISTELNSRFGDIPGWSENWYEVATHFCRVDARIPDRVDRLKSLGNAIVPQVAYELIKAIQEVE
ncbi:MAG: DNA cytosine methyltransferase [Dehalococcoidales bacterium]|nr:DNA cytosine methyltransferase [Dehalococcoidales bacterium]